VQEHEEIEVGEVGTVDYQAYFLRYFRPTALFEEAYDRYTRLAYEIYKATNDPQFGKVSKRFCWLDEAGGKFQFGTASYTQGGNLRRKVFQVLMKLYLEDPHAIGVSTISTLTGIMDRGKIRREIGAINKQLSAKIGLKFISPKNLGYYILQEV